MGETGRVAAGKGHAFSASPGWAGRNSTPGSIRGAASST